ncbi:MAG: class I SAM-dependent methyltransferase [Pyrinomonadaceae bacterium]
MNEFTYKKLIQEIYDKRAIIPFDGSTNKEIVAKDTSLIFTLLPDTSKRLLDVGCGAGWHLEKFSKLNYQFLTGIDLSKESLRNFAKRFDTNKIFLINEDFLTCEFPNKYDCVTNFYSCIGQFGKIKDKKFFKKVFNVLDKNGIFILTIFTTDKARNLEGRYKVRYSKNSSTSVLSNIVFREKLQKLKIIQTFAGNILEEEMTLYSESQIISFFKEANFAGVKILNAHSEYVSTFVGYR